MTGHVLGELDLVIRYSGNRYGNFVVGVADIVQFVENRD